MSVPIFCFVAWQNGNELSVCVWAWDFQPNIIFRIYLFLVIWTENLSDVLHVHNNLKLFIFLSCSRKILWTHTHIWSQCEKNDICDIKYASYDFDVRQILTKSIYKHMRRHRKAIYSISCKILDYPFEMPLDFCFHIKWHNIYFLFSHRCACAIFS